MSLKKELLSGAVYIAIARYTGFFIQMGITMFLSRLLTPETYGVVALSTVMLAIFALLSDIGIGPAVIQNQTLSNKDMDSIHTFTAYLGLVLGIAFFFCAPLISRYYNNEEVLPICQFLSLSIVFGCFNSVPSSLLYRAQNFKFITIVTLITQVIGGVISVLLAYLGKGAFSLVIPGLITSLLTIIIFKRVTKVHLVFKIDWEPLKRIFSFSVFQFFANVISFLSRNVDSMLVGKYIGLKPLGYYNKSYNLMGMPLQYITGVFIPVLLPAFSKRQNDLKFIEEKYSQILRLFAFAGIPLATMLYYCADELIYMFFGGQWDQSVPCFKILAISVPFQVLGFSSGSIFQATDNTKPMFWNGFIGSIITLCSFAFAVMKYGTIEALAWGCSISMIVTTFICFFIMYHIVLKSSFLHFLDVMLPTVIFGIALIAVMQVIIYIPFNHWSVAMIIKMTFCTIFSVVYIQLLGYYDVLFLIKKSMLKMLNKLPIQKK